MPHYFYPLHRPLFEGLIQPALASAWRLQSFEPARELCTRLLPAVADFKKSCGGLHDATLVECAADRLSFDRATWRCLTGEVLLFAAADLPNLQIAPRSLAWLLRTHADLDSFVRQAHFGSREVRFGAAVYAPGRAGMNDTGDVARFAEFLGALDADHWHGNQLIGLAGLESDDDRTEEIELLRYWVPKLADLYASAEKSDHIVICEAAEPSL